MLLQKEKHTLRQNNKISTITLIPVVEEPEFTEYIENVTVPAGRNIKLACSVKNLGSYKYICYIVNPFHN
ncbi:hypothetical protein FF38_13252 [Lucilia cuprina]|uniref:Ig-like domain-containing protein n=1 Tax=Lucilia cuprina TaxID=7375 RepID=A0A0L0CLU3_LUCCU|nr:hypothetical protein FF38_13252 [Lucilia cuprina]